MMKLNYISVMSIRLGIVWMLLTILACSGYLILEQIIEDNSVHASLINTAGRQRMLSQRIVLLANGLRDEKEVNIRSAIHTHLKEAIHLMEESHAYLLQGDPSLEQPVKMSDAMHSLFYGPTFFADRAVQHFLKTAQEMVSSEQNKIKISLKESNDLLALLDKIANQYQKESEQKSNILHSTQFVVLMVTLLILVWSVTLVRPILDRLRLEIANRYRSEENLRKLSSAVEHSPASVVITDIQGNIEYVNPKFIEITGYTLEEIIGKNIGIFKSGKVPEETYQHLWKTILAGQEWKGDLLNRRKSGELYWETVSISSIRNPEGKIINFVSIKEDISKRKAMEQALLEAKKLSEVANQIKSEFLANMSHEIRTPMNAIIGLCRLALRGAMAKKQTDYLTRIQASSHSLLNIINDILDFSKIEANQLSLKFVGFNLDDILENLAHLAFIKAENKDLELLFSQPPELPNALIGDGLRLGQILTNLTDNAIKFTEQGEIVISVVLEERVAGQVRLRFSVQDSGIGMTQEQMDRIFHSFSQADSSTTRRYGGTGLGLSISKRLVEMMAGTIRVDSKLGQGSCFSFTAIFALQQTKNHQSLQLGALLQGKRVLVVDDSRMARDIMGGYLTALSFVATTVSSGEEALEEIKRHNGALATNPYAVVIMDWKMPGMDGLETARRLWAVLPRDNTLTLIMMTTFGTQEALEQTATLPLHGILCKPVRYSNLHETIMTAFHRQTSPIPCLPTAQEKPGRQKTQHGFGGKILVVDDNHINLEIVLELLEESGLQVMIATNGRECIEIANRHVFDLVLMDIQMPEMDGLQATEILRQNPRFQKLPIIAITAHAMEGDRERFLGMGMDDYITKPVDPKKLFKIIKEWLPSQKGVPQALKRQEPKSREKGGSELPDELPGIHIHIGLKHVDGNRVFFAQLLREFRQDYQNIVGTIRTFLDQEETEEVLHVIHTLKGIAGSLGALELSLSVKTLEVAVKTGLSEVYADLLDRFENALMLVLQASHLSRDS